MAVTQDVLGTRIDARNTFSEAVWGALGTHERPGACSTHGALDVQ